MIRTLLLSIFLAFTLCGYCQQGRNYSSIHTALADTASFVVPEISTQELTKVMAEGSSLILDGRPHEEWAIGHIPGAINVAPKPGMPMSLYTSDVHEILRLVNGNKNAALVIYCNGPFCDKSKRLSADLITEGFTNVMRYQLGTPVWRATGNVMEIEKEGLIYFRADPSTVWVDAREENAYKSETIKGAVNIPSYLLTGIKNTGVIKEAKDDMRLPMLDHNARIVVFANNGGDATAVAAAITKEAFHNVNFYNGSFQEVKQFLEAVRSPDEVLLPGKLNEDPSKMYIQLKFNIDVNAPTVGIHTYTLLTNNPGKDSIEAREILQAKVLLPLAMQKHDAALFDSILASDFLYQDEEAFFNRAEYILDRVNGKWMISDVQYENMVLEFFDGYGILTYRNKVKEKDEFGKDQLYTWFWTDVWVKENGKWKLRDLRAIN